MVKQDDLRLKQQAAEKALKGLILSLGGEPWGHAIHRLLASLEDQVEVPPEILDAGRRLDRHYIPSRYPNGFAEGFPGDIYTEGEARGAVSDAEAVVRLCRDHLARS